uniref:Uncharacterized protein n=1 Tax=Parascaris equorum TaxID=6256 RepID=A0A914RPV4_PAREQ
MDDDYGARDDRFHEGYGTKQYIFQYETTDDLHFTANAASHYSARRH